MAGFSLLGRGNEIWQSYEIKIHTIIKLAIKLFVAKKSLPESENELNRIFYNCLVDANYQLQLLDTPPFYEANIQPSFQDVERAARESKRPDFQWGFCDYSEADAQKSVKQYVLECKRLGTPIGGWEFNRNYVKHGVKRFIQRSHGYALDVDSAAMLGYIQSMEKNEILEEVNTELDIIGQKRIQLTSGQSSYLETAHSILRELNGGQLILTHFWIDIKRVNRI